jgi:hypothetical protein
MNPRERTIAYAVLAAVVLAAGVFLFHEVYLVPLRQRQDEARAKSDALKMQQIRIDKVENPNSNLNNQLKEWRKLSLPQSVSLCLNQYQEHLRGLMRASGFFQINVKGDEASMFRSAAQPSTIKKETFYTPLNFTVTGRGDLLFVVRLLEKFYRTPLLHKITGLTIKRHDANGSGGSVGLASKSREVDIELKVEALIVSGAEDRPELLPVDKVAPNNLARQDYAAIAANNPFFGPAPPQAKPDEGPDPTISVSLINITRTEQGWQAWLHSTADDKIWCLRPQEGYVLFEVKNKRGVLKVMGEVVHIDLNKLVFYAAKLGKHYRIVPGQSLADAMRTPLTEAQVRALEQTQGAGERLESSPSSFVEGHPRGFPGVRKISTP